MGRERVVIVGAGVGGLTAALAFARQGHEVTLLERDAFAPGGSPDEAFASPRRGAPQVHQTHGFLARLQVLLAERFPDVLDQLRAAGGMVLPTTADLGEPQPGDEQLHVIIVRRTTLEWVLRQAVLAEPGVELRSGATVAGVVAGDAHDTPPSVAGVRLDDGAVVEAGVVVVATGPRGDLPGWLDEIGAPVSETVHKSGLMYLTRWYHLPDAFDVASLDPKLGGDLGFVKYLGVPGDGGTLSITLAIRPDDAALRATLSRPEGFEQACRLLPGPDQFFVHGPLRPIGDVRPMGGLLNRLRRFLDGDGRPVVLGLHAVGDVHTCTNPLYGRGCTLAAVQAVLLADATAAHDGDPEARAMAYERACAREVEPWFHVSVELDKLGADPAGFAGSPESPSPFAPVLVAAQTDPVLGRGLARFWNLLATPMELAADTEYTARVAAVLADPGRYPPPPREGPSRDELLAALTQQEEAASA